MKVRVIDNGKSYNIYQGLAEKYIDNELWFDCGFSHENGAELELIEYVNHGNFEKVTVAVCKDNENRVILIGKNSIEEIEGEIEFKINELYTMNCDYGVIKKGDIVELVDIVEAATEEAYLCTVKRKDGITSSCFSYRLDKYEQPQQLLPIGTKLKLVKPIIGFEDVQGRVLTVIQSNNTHAYLTCAGYRFSIARSEIEDGFYEVVKDEWSEWKFDSWRNMYYRVKGNKIQAKDNFNRVQSKCLPQDTFDLEKGLRICKARLDLKEVQQDLDELTK